MFPGSQRGSGSPQPHVPLPHGVSVLPSVVNSSLNHLTVRGLLDPRAESAWMVHEALSVPMLRSVNPWRQV